MKETENKKKKGIVQICPACNSKEISTDFSNPAAVASGVWINSKTCQNCGYSSDFFPQIESRKVPRVKDIRDIPKRDLVNINNIKRIAGYGYISWAFRIVIGLAAILIYFFTN